MNTWILMLVLYTGDYNTSTMQVEFNSKEACQAAYKAAKSAFEAPLKENHSSSSEVWGLCAKK